MPSPPPPDPARTRDILRVLTRVAIPRGQLVLYKLAVQSAEKGFSSAEMAKAIQYDAAQFRGLMAALSTRINRSPRETYPTKKPGVDLMFLQKWGGNQYHHTPRPELLAAIERLPELSAWLANPLEQIVAGGSLSAKLPADVPPRPAKPVDGDDDIKPGAPFHEVLRTLDEGGLYFPGETVANVLLALQVKRFVILTGISGTGKTRIAQAIAGRFRLAQEVSGSTPYQPSNAEIIPVRPDWTDNRGLLGFYNPLTRSYVTTPFLRLLLAAASECKRAAVEQRPPHPFFVLLDEMNLARVEHYFSDLLSAMESAADGVDANGGVMHLHDEASLEEDEATAVPRRLRIPANLFIVGTVNVDESTYMFSPKVLDRAFTVEFNGVDLGGLTRSIEDGGELDLVRWDGTLPPPRPASRVDWRWLMEHRDGALGAQLTALHDLLATGNRHFGYRVACEIARFVWLAVAQAGDDDASADAAARAALDLAVLQKVLVKLAGTQAELTRVLDDILWFTLTGQRGDTDRKLERWRLDPVEGEVVPADEASEEVPVLPRSAAKLWRMRSRLQERGFTSWIE